MGDFGIKVAEPEFDVETAAEKNLSLKSGQTLLKEFARGEVTMSLTPTTINHKLTYHPQFLVWTQYPDYPDYESQDVVLLMTGNFDAGAAYVTTSDLKLLPSQGQGNNSDAKYYIFYEPLVSGSAPSITPSSSYGLKISKDGVDAVSANIFEQTFNSEKSTMKIIEGGIVSTGSGNIDIALAHGLSVIPGYLIFFKVNSGKWYSTWEKEDVSGTNVQVGAISEASNVYVQIRRTASCTVTVKVYAFVDPGN